MEATPNRQTGGASILGGEPPRQRKIELFDWFDQARANVSLLVLGLFWAVWSPLVQSSYPRVQPVTFLPQGGAFRGRPGLSRAAGGAFSSTTSRMGDNPTREPTAAKAQIRASCYGPQYFEVRCMLCNAKQNTPQQQGDGCWCLTVVCRKVGHIIVSPFS